MGDEAGTKKPDQSHQPGPAPQANRKPKSTGKTSDPPKPAQVDKIADKARPSWLAAPPKISLGHVTVGKRATHTISITALMPDVDQGPRCLLSVSGIPEMSVERAPGYIPTTKNASRREDDIVLTLRPAREGKLEGTLVLNVIDYHEVVSIPIVGTAYHGAPFNEDLQPPRPPAPAGQLVPLPRSVDLGEQIVGSQHSFTVAVASLSNVTSRSGDIEGTIIKSQSVPSDLGLDMGTEAFEFERTKAHVTSNQDVPLRAWFKPQRTGRFRADLALTTRWQDGVFADAVKEHHQMVITAAARKLEEAPEQPAPESPTQRAPLDPKTGGKPATAEQVGRFTIAASEAASKARLLASTQRDGLEKAQHEILQDTIKPVPKPSLFSVLADLALTMAVGGLAQVVGKLIAQKLVGALKPSLNVGEVRNLRLTDGLGAAIKDGLKGGLAIAIKANGAAGKMSTGRAESTSPTVDFFARQRTLLTKLESHNADLITNEQGRLLPALGGHERAIIAVFDQLRDSFAEAASGALESQALATVSQWTAGIAQESVGKDTASRGNEEVGTTTAFVPFNKSAGVIDLHARLDGDLLDPAKVVVHRAELHNVAQDAANRFQNVALDTLRVPVRIVVESSAGTAIITRDEVGRVHVAGALPDQDPNIGRTDRLDRKTDVQLNRDAERICKHILSKPLTVPLRTNLQSKDEGLKS